MKIKSQLKYPKVEQIFNTYLEKTQLRKTSERQAILKEVYSRNDHFDADSLYHSMIKKKYHVSRATVYNTLTILVDCNLVIRHVFNKGGARYEKSFGFSQHDHMICILCNKITEFCDPNIQRIQDNVEKITNFKTNSHSLVLYGICEKCNNN